MLGALATCGLVVLLVWWLFVPSGPPAPPISLPPDVNGMPGMAVPITAETKGKLVKWLVFDANGIVEDGRAQLFPQDSQWHSVYFISPRPGRYGLIAVTATGHLLHHATAELASTTVTLGDVPPGPGPGPTPGPAPIPADGLHVLIVYDAKTLGKLPKDQELILFAQSIRQYLDAKCPVGADGKTHEYRIWDQGVDASQESPLWQSALKLPRQGLPWLIVSNPAKGGGYQGPLPANVTDTLKLLAQYGG